MGGRKRLALAGIGLLALVLAVFFLYDRTRATLIHRESGAWRKQVTDYLNSNGPDEPRAAVTVAREFLLDHPESDEAELELGLARTICGQRSGPDWLFVMQQVERAAERVLARIPSARDPRPQDFTAAGFAIDPAHGQWGYRFLVRDLDGDGRKDVVLPFPDYEGARVCYVFRRTVAGWSKHCLASGLPILGVEPIRLDDKGRTALLIASLPGSQYRPELFLDAFAWQNGRFDSVLSTVIRDGFKFQIRQGDQTLKPEIRVLRQWLQDAWRSTQDAREWTAYAWTGRQFEPQSTRTLPPRLAGHWLALGADALSAGRYDEASSNYRAALSAPPPPANSYDDFQYGGADRARFELMLSEALAGRAVSARAAAQQYLKRISDRDGPNVAMAKRFLSTCRNPEDLGPALCVVGEAVRLLEAAGRQTPSTRPASELFLRARIQPSRLVDGDLDGNGRQDAVAALHWEGGSCIVALLSGAGEEPWHVHTLALARKQRLEMQGYNSWQGIAYYQPDAPALSLFPSPTEIRLLGIESGKPARVRLEFVHEGQRNETGVAWDGRRFTALLTATPQAADPESDLSRVEAWLFEKRDYRQALEYLEAVEERIKRSGLSATTKTELLLETYYHQAICHRKRGDRRSAAVVLSALWRANPDTSWGRLARRWLDVPQEKP